MDVEEYMNRIEEKYKNPYIQLPNKLVQEINSVMIKEGMGGYTHYAFGFTVLSAFLHKYTHYVDIDTEEHLVVNDLKDILGYSRTNKKVNPVSKRDGILDNHNIIEYTQDVPMKYMWEDRGDNSSLKDKKILCLSDLQEDYESIVFNDIVRTSYYFVPIPVFQLDTKEKTGTINDFRGTYKLTYKEFAHFVFSDSLNLKDFIFYCYIKSYSYFKNEVSVPRNRINIDVGLSPNTSKKVSEKLQKEGILIIKDEKNINKFRKTPKIYSLTRSI